MDFGQEITLTWQAAMMIAAAIATFGVWRYKLSNNYSRISGLGTALAELAKKFEAYKLEQSETNRAVESEFAKKQQDIFNEMHDLELRILKSTVTQREYVAALNDLRELIKASKQQ